MARSVETTIAGRGPRSAAVLRCSRNRLTIRVTRRRRRPTRASRSAFFFALALVYVVRTIATATRELRNA
jgi:hypothetical protein